MTALLRYDAACRAIAEARAIDEVKDIIDKADAVREYARRANNRELEIDAAEIRLRAHRRWGELVAEMKQTGQFNEGRKKTVLPEGQFPPERVTLDDMGVSRNFSSQGQKMAAVPEEQFEGMVGEWRDRVSKENERVTTTILKQDARAHEREAFAARTAQGCTVADLDSLIAKGLRFGAILADPPSQFETYSELGGDRAARRHYQTDGIEAIMALPVMKLAADNCLLAVWTSGPHLQHALAYIDAWGFAYKTIGFDWMKLNPSGAGLFMGPGYWTRANAEIVLFATRGHPRRLDAGVLSAILAPVGEHSRKPDDVHAGLERLVAGPYLELYGRRQRDNWTVWGNEIGREALVVPEAPPASPEGEPAWWAKARQMRHDEKLQIIEIAVKLGKSPSTVHYALHRPAR